MVRNEERSDCSEMSGYGEHPNRKCISGSDGSLIPARSRDHTGLWLLSVAKFIAKVRTFAADFCSKESPAEPMTGKPLQNGSSWIPGWWRSGRDGIRVYWLRRDPPTNPGASHVLVIPGEPLVADRRREMLRAGAPASVARGCPLPAL